MTTKIAWVKNPDGTDGEVWNPVIGCTRVSSGCQSCYASALHNRRYKANVKAAMASGCFGNIGPPEARGGGVELPMPPQYDLPFAKVQLLPERLERPLHWTKPRRVFVNSMSDLFHEDVPDEFIDRVFAVMALCPQHTFQVLTKRPERMREYLSDPDHPWSVRIVIKETMWNHVSSMSEARRVQVKAAVYSTETFEAEFPLPNVWLGVSVEDQETADARIPELLATPAAVRWVSLEPQLGPVDFSEIYLSDHVLYALTGERGEYGRDGDPHQPTWPINDPGNGARLDWVVQGGESGAKARPFDVQWARDVRDQCAAAGVPYFLKQLGAKPLLGGTMPMRWVKSRAGSDESEWPEDLRQCRAWPKVPA